MMLETFTREMFEPFEGASFAITFTGRDDDTLVELIEVKGLGQGMSREAFSLLFRAPAGEVQPQGVHRVTHAELGALEIFLVPLGPGRGGVLYEAVFT